MNIGDQMPAFSVADQNGNIVTNEQMVGKKTVLYFYPKDSTPGCTAEACNLRDNYERMLAAGYQVYGSPFELIKFILSACIVATLLTFSTLPLCSKLCP